MKLLEKNFSNQDLWKLFIPIMIEQFLEYSVGLADSIMVGHLGENAISGVSLVDFLIQLIISFFIALSTGGAIVIGQFIGKKEKENAGKTASQLILITVLLGLFTTLCIYSFKKNIIKLCFGQISSEVYENILIYLNIVGISIPFLALYNAGASIFRSIGNPKLPMKIMTYMNILNVVGNAFFIYFLKIGVAGAGLSTLISRIGASIIIIYFLILKPSPLSINKNFNYRFDKKIIKMILNIGIPYGLENGTFYFGRFIIVSLIATFGTTAITANSIAQTIVMFQALPGMAMGVGLSIVISQYFGIRDFENIRFYTKKIFKMIYMTFIIVSIITLLLLPFILKLYNLSEETKYITTILVWGHALFLVIWPFGNTLPIVFRACGKAKFPMIIGITSMIFCRIILAFIFSKELGVIGVWIAMFIDWAVKGGIFLFKYCKDNWLEKI